MYSFFRFHIRKNIQLQLRKGHITNWYDTILSHTNTYKHRYKKAIISNCLKPLTSLWRISDNCTVPDKHSEFWIKRKYNKENASVYLIPVIETKPIPIGQFVPRFLQTRMPWLPVLRKVETKRVFKCLLQVFVLRQDIGGNKDSWKLLLDDIHQRVCRQIIDNSTFWLV